MEQITMGATNAIDMSNIVKERTRYARENPESAALQKVLEIKDLVQRLEEMQRTCQVMINRFQAVEPSIDLILNLKETFEELENRTVTVVTQFTKEIFLKEDEADQIILDLNTEVNRVRENIEELLGLSQDFDSIAEEIQKLIQLDDDLEKLTTDVKDHMDMNHTPVVPSTVGQTIPVDERLEGSFYLMVTQETGSGENAIRYATYEDENGKKYYFKTNGDQVDVNTGKTQLFSDATTLNQFISKLDEILKKKVYINTYYANLTTTYAGSAAPYSQSVSVPGVKATDEPFVGCINSDTSVTTSQAQSKAFGNISRVVTSDNAITVYCDKKKPEAALNLRIVCFRTD